MYGFQTYTDDHPNVTVSEAAYFCDVSQTTIRRVMKEYNMHFWKDDRGVIHIRSLDLLKYYRKTITAKIMNAESRLQTYVAKRNKALEEYDSIRRTYDDQLEGDALYVSMDDIQKVKDRIVIYESELKKALEVYVYCIGHLAKVV